MSTDPRITEAVDRELKRAPEPTDEQLRRLAGLMGLAPAPRKHDDSSDGDAAA